MAQDTTPAMVIYTGVYDAGTQTYQTDFEAPFDKGSYGEIKVAFVRRGLTDYTYDPDTYTVDEYNYVHWTGADITPDDIICIVRVTQDGQPYTYPNNQKHIEKALDNLSRQIQEIYKKTENALTVDPSWMPVAEGGSNDPDKMDPIAWLQTIVRSKGKTLRELRIDNDYIEYTTDDPEASSKTWNVIAGVKTGNGGVVSHIRETKVLAEDGVTYIPYLEYSTDGGNTWNPAGRGQSELEHLYVKKAGDTMTGDLAFQYSTSYPTLYVHQSNTTPDRLVLYEDGVSDKTIILDLAQSTILLEKVYTTKINNGYDIAVPVTNSTDTLALKSEVDLAANSGSQLTNKGVWYAKMYAATVPPAAEDGTNYADFSQTDGQGNPIIVTYNRVDGAWVQDQTITPPADYNGYVTVTSKIWDIVEQDGQQGGLVLWAFNTKTFTPYPKIISFEDAHLTGDSTVEMPLTPSGTSIVNVDYLSNHTGSGKNVGDVFFTMRNDSALSGAVECNGATYNTEDFIGTGTISGLLAAGKIPYVSLATYATLLSTQGSCGVFGWDGGNTTAFRVPSLNDIFVETGTAAQIGDYIAPGVPQLEGEVSTARQKYDEFPDKKTGVFATSVITGQGAGFDSGKNNTGQMLVKFDAHNYNEAYGNSNTVQPNTVRYRAMVQLATGATDEALETCTQVLADVADLKDHRVIAFQAPTADNSYTWYRKYADGWVEQGGRHIGASSDIDHASNQITLPVEMADTNYDILTSQVQDAVGNGFYDHPTLARRTATTIINVCFFGQVAHDTTIQWEVKGMAA